MQQLMQYLQFSIYTSFNPITFSGDRTNVLNRWLVKKEPIDPNHDVNLNPFINLNLDDTSASIERKIRESWRYYASHHEESSFYLNNAEELYPENEDKTIYHLCNVFCKEDKPLISYIWHFNTPIRIWINGELVVNYSYTFNNHSNLFIYNFKKGDNIVLVERQIFSKYKSLGVFSEGFEFTIKPVNYYEAEEPQDLFDKNVIDACYNSYSILPSKAIYNIEQSIRFMVLPKAFISHQPENIRISILDSRNNLLKAFEAVSTKTYDITLEAKAKGVIRIYVQSLADERKASDIHIFIGDFVKERNILISKAEKRNDCSNELINIFKRMGKLPALCNSVGELHQEYLYNYLFKKYSEFENYLETDDSSEEKDVFEVFNNSTYLFKDSSIDEGFIAYSVFLPRNYKPDKKYPLVITLRRGILLSLYPSPRPYVDKQQFDEAIIVSMPGRGDLNLDYINEINFFYIIKELTERFNIDKDSIYFIGECAGATKAYGLALRMPDLAAGISVMGMPRVAELECLNNLNNLTIHNLCNVDNHKIPNLASLFMLKDIKKVKNWLLTNLSHLELPEIYNNGTVYRNIIGEKKDKYPRLIHFHIYEPQYNKSYWLRIDYIKNISQKAYVKAEIKDNTLIEVSTSNAKIISLYLSTDYMELLQCVDIIVNGKMHKMQLYKYSRIELSIDDNNVNVMASEINEAEFESFYNNIQINEELLGIKQVYLNKCIVITPEVSQASNNIYIEKMLYALQNPLKEFVRNYKYKLAASKTLDIAELSKSNFVYFNNVKHISTYDKQLFVNERNFSIGYDSITINDNCFSGQYFTVIKQANPYNLTKTSLLIIYNSEELEEELIKFWESFYANSIFHSDAVIYNNGTYYSIREKL